MIVARVLIVLGLSGLAVVQQTPGRTPAPARRPAPAATGMSVSASIDGKNVAIAPVALSVVRLADRFSTVSAAALAMPVGAGRPLPAAPASSITYVWVTHDAASARVISQKRPALLVQFRDAPGISPDDFAPVVVRAIGTAAGPHVLAISRGRVDQASRSEADWDIASEVKYAAVTTTVEVKNRGVARVTPPADLEPGHYGVVLRPTGNKRFAGASVLSDAEEGKVFGIAWVFAVK